MSSNKDLIVISGYYGFANLGDEAILEELIAEISKLVDIQKIVVLSNDPVETEKTFGVRAIGRWNLANIWKYLSQSKVFVSGGGGLFQDVENIRSVVYYAFLIGMAKAAGAKVLIYAQGLGPLSSSLSRQITAMALTQANECTVRDQKSFALLQSLGGKGSMTADPVWLLKPSALSPSDQFKLDELKNNAQGLLVGLSLREHSSWGPAESAQLAKNLHASLPAQAQIILLPLQEAQDKSELTKIQRHFLNLGRSAGFLPQIEVHKASQWLSIFKTFDCVVGMRFHAVIMALMNGLPVLGIPYDPKVESVLKQFDQPMLPLPLDGNRSAWDRATDAFVSAQEELAKKASTEAAIAAKAACQNIEYLTKILT